LNGGNQVPAAPPLVMGSGRAPALLGAPPNGLSQGMVACSFLAHGGARGESESEGQAVARPRRHHPRERSARRPPHPRRTDISACQRRTDIPVCQRTGIPACRRSPESRVQSGEWRVENPERGRNKCLPGGQHHIFQGQTGMSALRCRQTGMSALLFTVVADRVPWIKRLKGDRP
jgi:hypothetical protein